MPFFEKHQGNKPIDSDKSSIRSYQNAIASYEANNFDIAAETMMEVFRFHQSRFSEPSEILAGGIDPEHSIYFASIDLLGRSLRKMWCLDEAEVIFCFGIKQSLLCPRAHIWAGEYFSRWVSIFDRRDFLKSGVKIKRAHGEHPPERTLINKISLFIKEFELENPFDDELMLKIRECAKNGSEMIDFQELSNRLSYWGWKDGHKRPG